MSHRAILLPLICLLALGSSFGPLPRAWAGSKPAATPVSGPQQRADPMTASMFGLAGQGSYGQTLDPALLQAEYQARIRLRLIEIPWNDLQPTGPGMWAADKAQLIQQRIDTLTGLGSDVQFTLDL